MRGRRILIYGCVAWLALCGAFVIFGDVDPGHDRPVTLYREIGRVCVGNRETGAQGPVIPLYVRHPIDLVPTEQYPLWCALTLYGVNDRTTYTLYLPGHGGGQ